VHELSRLNVAESILGVFWSVWFAEFSRSVLGAESKISISTDALRTAYIAGALAAVLGLTGLLLVLRHAAQRLSDAEPLRPLADTIEDVSLLWGSFALISAIVIVVPVGSYIVFDGLSPHEVALSSVIIPVWLGAVLVLSIGRMARSRG